MCIKERGRGLVQNDDRCVLQHGPGNGDALALAARERIDIAVFQPLQMKDPEGLIYPPSDFILRQTVIFKTEGHFIGTVHSKKLTSRILKYRCCQFADFADTQPGGVLPVQAAEALPLSLIKLRYQSIDAPQQRGFSASAASAEHHAASRRDAAAHLTETGQLCLRILEFKFKLYHRKLFSIG